MNFTAPGTYRLALTVNDGVSAGQGFTNVVVDPAASGSGFFSLTPSVSGPNAVGSTVRFNARLWGFQFS